MLQEVIFPCNAHKNHVNYSVLGLQPPEKSGSGAGKPPLYFWSKLKVAPLELPFVRTANTLMCRNKQKIQNMNQNARNWSLSTLRCGSSKRIDQGTCLWHQQKQAKGHAGTKMSFNAFDMFICLFHFGWAYYLLCPPVLMEEHCSYTARTSWELEITITSTQNWHPTHPQIHSHIVQGVAPIMFQAVAVATVGSTPHDPSLGISSAAGDADSGDLVKSAPALRGQAQHCRPLGWEVHGHVASSILQGTWWMDPPPP